MIVKVIAVNSILGLRILFFLLYVHSLLDLCRAFATAYFAAVTSDLPAGLCERFEIYDEEDEERTDEVDDYMQLTDTLLIEILRVVANIEQLWVCG